VDELVVEPQMQNGMCGVANGAGSWAGWGSMSLGWDASTVPEWEAVIKM